jgi:septal ring factor EnvC (AmiA/AmiB activator)
LIPTRFQLIAEEVEKVNPDLVVRDEEGKVNTVRHEAVNAMLLNEFLKEHRRVQKQEATIAQQQKEIATLAAQLKEQAALIQKVSAQLKSSGPSPHLASNKSVTPQSLTRTR